MPCSGQLPALHTPRQCVCMCVACRALRLLRLSLLSGNLSTMKTNREWLLRLQ